MPFIDRKYPFLHVSEQAYYLIEQKSAKLHFKMYLIVQFLFLNMCTCYPQNH